jgi:FkbM family methyltransferase
MSRRIAGALGGLVAGATAWMKPYRRAMTRALVAERLVQRVSIPTPGGPLSFETPSARSLHDPWSLYRAEPETIRWLDLLPAGETLWDIGANIGVYALYAARARGLNVVAFEPSASSYAVLIRNIEINRLGDQIAAYCLAFDAETRLDYLQMEHTEAGHSMHAFGAGRTISGTASAFFRQSVAGFAVDEFCALFRPPPPAHIKLDVDGIEPEILKGAAATLAAHVKTLLVEIEDAVPGRAIREFLASLGFAEDVAFGAEGARRNVLFRRAP